MKQFRRVEKYVSEAETVSVFYFGFISPCATGLTELDQRFTSARDARLSQPQLCSCSPSVL